VGKREIARRDRKKQREKGTHKHRKIEYTKERERGR
jgi:hypothetical protein